LAIGTPTKLGDQQTLFVGGIKESCNTVRIKLYAPRKEYFVVNFDQYESTPFSYFTVQYSTSGTASLACSDPLPSFSSSADIVCRQKVQSQILSRISLRACRRVLDLSSLIAATMLFLLLTTEITHLHFCPLTPDRTQAGLSMDSFRSIGSI